MKVVNKKKFIKSILVLLFLIIILVFSFSNSFTKKEFITTECDYVVSKGERLWDIAEQYKRPDQDIREYIYEIKKINGLDEATIYEGQTIKVIVYEEAE